MLDDDDSVEESENMELEESRELSVDALVIVGKASEAALEVVLSLLVIVVSLLRE